jgi:hypothetical protein
VKGLFVPRTTATTQRLSYVDIVKHTSPKANAPKEEDSMAFAPRKVSNASTISTQADEECSGEAKEQESKSLRNVSKHFYCDDMSCTESDFSGLACTTKQRKNKMENRKKDNHAKNQAKKHDIGLLAVIHCPRDEPDRSISPRFLYT